jgi:P4 family phage/plasmid primase-like protien
MFDNPPPGIVFKNGFVHITKEGLKIEDNDKKHLALSRLETEFTYDPKCPLFDKFLDEVLIGADAEQKKKAIWQAMGASLAQLGTAFQKAFILVGEGANGKSVLLKVWSEMIPKDRCTAITPQDMESEYNLAHMKTSLLNRVNEAPSSKIGKSSTVKAVISGDVVQARHIRQAPFEFVPRALHVFACNELPAFQDLSEGFARRWLIISFDKTFSEEEQNASLAQNLIEKELDAIICKSLIAISDAFVEGRYDEPVSSTRLRKSWHTDNDPIAAFIDEMCEVVTENVSKNGVSPKAMYTQYSMWCNLSGVSAVSKMMFIKRLKKLKHSTIKTGGDRLYKLKIKS